MRGDAGASTRVTASRSGDNTPSPEAIRGQYLAVLDGIGGLSTKSERGEFTANTAIALKGRLGDACEDAIPIFDGILLVKGSNMADIGADPVVNLVEPDYVVTTMDIDTDNGAGSHFDKVSTYIYC